MKERVYVAVLDMPEIVARAGFDHKYEGIAKFPAASRDISMIVPKTILAGDIEKVFDTKGGKLLERYELFDIYEGSRSRKAANPSPIRYLSGRRTATLRKLTSQAL